LFGIVGRIFDGGRDPFVELQLAVLPTAVSAL